MSTLLYIMNLFDVGYPILLKNKLASHF